MRMIYAGEGSTFEIFENSVHHQGYVEHTVIPKCDAKAGQWMCVSHNKQVRNNMERDGHCSEGNHVITWICFLHGPEVP